MVLRSQRVFSRRVTSMYFNEVEFFRLVKLRDNCCSIIKVNVQFCKLYILKKYPKMVKGTILLFVIICGCLCENTILFEEKQQSLVFKADWHPNINHLSEYITKFHKDLQQTDINQINISFTYCSDPIYLLQNLFQGIFTASKVSINLDGCRIGNEGIKNIIKVLKQQKLKSLSLDLSSTDIDENGLQLLSQFISDSALEKFQLKLVFLKIGDKGAQNLLSHPLPSTLIQLSIDLTFNKLGFKAIESFQQYMSKIKENNLKILKINLGSNNIQQKGAKLLKESLQRFTNIQQLLIDLYFNKIGPKGCEYITILAKNQQNIKKLTLNFDANSIQTEGGKHIGQSITNKTTLSSLQIGVANKNFGYNGFAAIADSISTLSLLKQLTIRVGVNRIGYKGAQKLINSITKLSLQALQLGLSQNFLTDQGLKIIGDSIKNQKQLKTLKINLGFNEARGYGPVSLLKIVQQSNINHLQIVFSQNPLEDAEIKLFIPYLSSILKKAHINIFQFSLLETKISEKLAKQLSTLFAKASQTNSNIKLTINSQQQTNRIRQQIQSSNKPLIQSSDL